jgi:hypothetical protein
LLADASQTTSRVDALIFSGGQSLEDFESPWKPAEVLQFEQESAKEPQNVGELYHLVLRRLHEVREDLEEGDFSQSELLKLARKTEKHYQLWLAGQLELRSRGIYSVTRESEVKAGKKPDVVVQRTSVNARIPIELKVADAWSGSELRKAFKKQLIGQYQRDRIWVSGGEFPTPSATDVRCRALERQNKGDYKELSNSR